MFVEHDILGFFILKHIVETSRGPSSTRRRTVQHRQCCQTVFLTPCSSSLTSRRVTGPRLRPGVPQLSFRGVVAAAEDAVTPAVECGDLTGEVQVALLAVGPDQGVAPAMCP